MNQGNVAQYELVARLIGLGYTVSLPCDPACVYDLILDNGKRLLRVQVKSCAIRKRNRYRADIARGCLGKVAYAPGSLDLFAISIPPEKAWYFIPFAVVQGQRWASLYPHDKCGLYEPYRDAWSTLDR